MANLKIQRLNSLPTQLQANCLYITKSATNPNYVDLTFTGNDAAIVTKVVSLSDIPQIVGDTIDSGIRTNFRAPSAGYTDSNTSAGWWSIGTINLPASAAARIFIPGTRNYGDNESVAGGTTIFLRGTNNINGVGLAGYFNAETMGQGTLSDVAFIRVGTGQSFRIYVNVPAFHALGAIVDMNDGSFVAGAMFAGTSMPAGLTTLPSLWNLLISGDSVMKADITGVVFNKGATLAGDKYTKYSPGATNYGTFLVGADPARSITTQGIGTLGMTTGNVHLDAAIKSGTGPDSDYGVYFNWYRGTHGVYFGNGTQSEQAHVSPEGNWIGRNLSPQEDNASDIGATSFRYANCYLGSNPIVSSDSRFKTDIQPALSLPFILGLRGVSYRITDAKKSVQWVDDGEETYQEPVFQEVENTASEIQVRDGVPVLVNVTKTEKVQVFDNVPVVDEAGNIVIKNGVTLTHPVPRMATRTRRKLKKQITSKEGIRRHQGFLADEVLSLMQKLGIPTDGFAGYVEDPETGIKALRYEQFIAPLTSALQTFYLEFTQLKEENIQMAADIAALKAAVASLQQK